MSFLAFKNNRQFYAIITINCLSKLSLKKISKEQMSKKIFLKVGIPPCPTPIRKWCKKGTLGIWYVNVTAHSMTIVQQVVISAILSLQVSIILLVALAEKNGEFNY